MNPSDQQRYSRQIKLPQVGIDGQARLLESRALIIGMGGLGSPWPCILQVRALGI